MNLSSGLLLTVLLSGSETAHGFSLKPRLSITAQNNNVNSSFRDYDSQPNTSCFKKSFKNDGNSKILKTSSCIKNMSSIRGGSKTSLHVAGSVNSGQVDSLAFPPLGKVLNLMTSFWGAGGVVMILCRSITRIMPIAVEPFKVNNLPSLSNFQLAVYCATCLWFAYVEGFKGFQKKFSPLVVSRSTTLTPLDGTPILHTLFAPFYSMGLFHATKKRKIISWSISIGVGFLIAAVKRLPYPWRNIIDGGVVAGLSWGAVSIVLEWFRVVIFGEGPSIDPALPNTVTHQESNL